MQGLFDGFNEKDFQFLTGLLESKINFSDDDGLQRALGEFMEDSTDADKRDDLIVKLRHEIRYAGSSDIAYFSRWMRGNTPGIPLKKVFAEAGRALKCRVDTMQTEREIVAEIATRFVEREFADLEPEKQQEMLENLGVDTEKATAFLKRSAGVFTIPVMIQAFNIVVVNGLIKQIIFGAIARIIGKALADKLFLLLIGRLPWWVSWIGPAAWTASLSWTAVDITGPAMRKTIPVTLYLGLRVLELDQPVDDSE